MTMKNKCGRTDKKTVITLGHPLMRGHYNVERTTFVQHCYPMTINEASKGVTYLLCFQHLLESWVFFLLLGALHRKSKIANFCHDLMKNH